jgi:pentatricopeptide repeat protein
MTTMLKVGVGADTVRYHRWFGHVLERRSTGAQDVARAERWVSLFLKVGVEADTISYNTVIKARAATRDVAKAERWMSALVKEGVEADTISYNTVIKACAGARDVARAEHWLSTMLRAGVEANTISSSTVRKACVEACDVARVEHWMSAMLKTGVDANAISVLPGMALQLQHCGRMVQRPMRSLNTIVHRLMRNWSRLPWKNSYPFWSGGSATGCALGGLRSMQMGMAGSAG